MLRKLYGNDVPIVRSRGYVQSKSWMPYVNTGQFIGTTGLGLRLEGMNLGLVNSPVTGTIQANSHVQSIGWSGYKTITPTTLIGTTGRNLRVEAIQFKLTGNLATKYVVSYRAHVQGLGWLPWKSDGATCWHDGSRARQIEAVQVRLVLKTAPTPKPGSIHADTRQRPDPDADRDAHGVGDPHPHPHGVSDPHPHGVGDPHPHGVGDAEPDPTETVARSTRRRPPTARTSRRRAGCPR